MRKLVLFVGLLYGFSGFGAEPPSFDVPVDPKAITTLTMTIEGEPIWVSIADTEVVIVPTLVGKIVSRDGNGKTNISLDVTGLQSGSTTACIATDKGKPIWLKINVVAPKVPPPTPVDFPVVSDKIFPKPTPIAKPPVIPPAAGQPKKISYPAAKSVAKNTKTPDPFVPRPSQASPAATAPKEAPPEVLQALGIGQVTNVPRAVAQLPSKPDSLATSPKVLTPMYVTGTTLNGGTMKVDAECTT